MVYGFGFDSIGSGFGPGGGSCEQGTKPLWSINWGNFLITYVTLAFQRGFGYI